MNDRRRLFTHRAIAEKIDGDPRLIGKAHENLETWRMRSFDGALPPALQEWKDILNSQDWPSIRKILVDDSEESNRLRQSSPFPGILTEPERVSAREAASG